MAPERGRANARRGCRDGIHDASEHRARLAFGREFCTRARSSTACAITGGARPAWPGTPRCLSRPSKSHSLGSAFTRPTFASRNLESDSAVRRRASGRAHRHDLREPGSMSSGSPSAAANEHEPLRSSHPFAVQRAFGRMALPPVSIFRTATPIRAISTANLKARGMDFVTITDHDTIDGCLQIADLPDTFISEQITTYFPHDPCKIHLLVWGISEAQHAEIVDAAREHFRSAELPATASRSRMRSRIRFTASTANSRPRISSG